MSTIMTRIKTAIAKVVPAKKPKSTPVVIEEKIETPGPNVDDSSIEQGTPVEENFTVPTVIPIEEEEITFVPPGTYVAPIVESKEFTSALDVFNHLGKPVNTPHGVAVLYSINKDGIAEAPQHFRFHFSAISK